MTKKITAIKARQNLGELLEKVYYQNDHFMITRREKVMAVVIPADTYECYIKQRAKDFAIIDEIRALHKDKTPEEVERDVAAAIQRVRAKKKKKKVSHAKGRA